jgi:hypothetical protein
VSIENLTRYTIDYVSDSCDGDYVQHNVSKDGEYVLFDELATALKPSHNIATLKLPTLEECVKQVRHIWNEEYIPTEVSEAIEAVLDFIGRQNQQ